MGSARPGLEVWRGGVNTWQCDEMGRMNARFHVAHATEGLAPLAAALGLAGAFRPSAEATLLVTDHHIRFIREARARAALQMTAGVLEMGESDARLLQLLVDSASGEVAASFQTQVAHVTAREGRAFVWSDHTRRLADALKAETPPAAAPQSLGLEPFASQASLARADELGLFRLAAGAFGPQDCDVFGRMRPEVFIGRVSDNVPRLAQEFRGVAVGGAVLEYRLAYLRLPRAGDLFEIRSGVTAVERRSHRLVHWMVDPLSGGPWAVAEAVAVSIDLNARKVLDLSDADRDRLRSRIVPGLSL